MHAIFVLPGYYTTRFRLICMRSQTHTHTNIRCMRNFCGVLYIFFMFIAIVVARSWQYHLRARHDREKIIYAIEQCTETQLCTTTTPAQTNDVNSKHTHTHNPKPHTNIRACVRVKHRIITVRRVHRELAIMRQCAFG